MRKTIVTLILIIITLISICSAKTDYQSSEKVELKLLAYCLIDIKGPVSVTVPQPGGVPENSTKVTISCNYKYNVDVKWDLPKSWPKKVTTHDDISGHNISPGIRKGKVWLAGSTSLQDLADIYNGTVTITISVAN